MPGGEHATERRSSVVLVLAEDRSVYYEDKITLGIVMGKKMRKMTLEYYDNFGWLFYSKS